MGALYAVVKNSKYEPGQFVFSEDDPKVLSALPQLGIPVVIANEVWEKGALKKPADSISIRQQDFMAMHLKCVPLNQMWTPPQRSEEIAAATCVACDARRQPADLDKCDWCDHFACISTCMKYGTHVGQMCLWCVTIDSSDEENDTA